jgi:hypothetical protein
MDQAKLEDVYDKLLKRMIDGLVEKRVRQKKSQVWFNEELAKLRRAMRKAESQWLCTYFQ